jgi:hypothetical protein
MGRHLNLMTIREDRMFKQRRKEGGFPHQQIDNTFGSSGDIRQQSTTCSEHVRASSGPGDVFLEKLLSLGLQGL